MILSWSKLFFDLRMKYFILLLWKSISSDYYYVFSIYSDFFFFILLPYKLFIFILFFAKSKELFLLLIYVFPLDFDNLCIYGIIKVLLLIYYLRICSSTTYINCFFWNYFCTGYYSIKFNIFLYLFFLSIVNVD